MSYAPFVGPTIVAKTQALHWHVCDSLHVERGPAVSQVYMGDVFSLIPQSLDVSWSEAFSMKGFGGSPS